jgi:aspartate carbamoyltransferase catalytic subunit
LNVCIVGDISHSRVALSNIYGFQTMGANVSVCGPGTLIPRSIESLGVRVHHRIEDAIRDADVLNVLRLQLERQEAVLLPSLREYHNYFGITRKRLEASSKKVSILHPGPINRDVEISADVADGEHSLILTQVLNGVAIRMAVLYLLGTSL